MQQLKKPPTNEKNNIDNEDRYIKTENQTNDIHVLNDQCINDTNDDIVNYDAESNGLELNNTINAAANEEYINEEDSSVEENTDSKPTLILRTEFDGRTSYGCSFCPRQVFSRKWNAMQHVAKGKFHDQKDAHDTSIDPKKPTVIISRGKDGKRKIACSTCLKTFKKKVNAYKHVKNLKVHDLEKFSTSQEKVGRYINTNEPEKQDPKQNFTRKEEKSPFLIEENSPLLIEENSPFLIEENIPDSKKSYKCNKCPQKMFLKKQEATRHLERHLPLAERKKVSCDECNERFVRKLI